MLNLTAPLPDALSLITDGQPERLAITTRHNTDHYILPAGVGEILRVTLVTGAPKAFLFLEAPVQTSYFHLLADGVRPASPDQARAYLRQVHEKFRSNLWYRLGDTLFLFPAPVNAGESLLVTYQP